MLSGQRADGIVIASVSPGIEPSAIEQQNAIAYADRNLTVIGRSEKRLSLAIGRYKRMRASRKSIVDRAQQYSRHAETYYRHLLEAGADATAARTEAEDANTCFQTLVTGADRDLGRARQEAGKCLP